MREVYESLESDVIYIVPNFISQGYFCQQVLPRELRLTGPTTLRDGKTDPLLRSRGHSPEHDAPAAATGG